MVHSVTWAALPEWVNEPWFPSGENQQILKELLLDHCDSNPTQTCTFCTHRQCLPFFFQGVGKTMVKTEKTRPGTNRFWTGFYPGWTRCRDQGGKKPWKSVIIWGLKPNPRSVKNLIPSHQTVTSDVFCVQGVRPSSLSKNSTFLPRSSVFEHRPISQGQIISGQSPFLNNTD